MKKYLLLVAFALGGCTDQKAAIDALENQGFHDIKITGYSFFECSETDTFHTGFVATNYNGRRVTGTVCSGILKGSTIRY